jgi:hypothetical protein
MTNFVIRNQTPDYLELHGASTVLKLPPLQRTRIGTDPQRALGPAAAAARRDNAVEWEPEPIRSSRLLVITWCAALAVVALIVGILGYRASGEILPFAFGAGVAILLLGAAVSVDTLGRRRGSGEGRPSRDSREPLEPARIRGDFWELGRDYLIASSQGLVLVVLLAVGICAPAAAIYYGTELSSVIRFDSWHDPVLLQGAASQHVVVGRALQLLMVILVSLVPALMYVQFDREKLTTLVDRWLHAIFRLDPTLDTVADVDAKYGRRVEEFYGATLGTGVNPPRKRARSRSPVLVATLLIATGWILVLLNDAASRGPNQPLPSVQQLFRPAATPLAFAFLGAYFLAVQVTLRGYVRGDLRPKTYNVITVRIILAVILAWVMQGIFGTNEAVLAASFLAGFLPNTMLRRIREAAGIVNEKGSDDFEDNSPLTVLDGMDIYERTRLEEEGITGVQALARHDLIDLILSSRIPVPRIIDWLDQALLYQHASEAVPALRKRGVRTATDFLQVAGNPTALTALLADPDGPGVNATLLQSALAGDEWLAYVCNWRTRGGATPPQVRRYDVSGTVSFEPLSRPVTVPRARTDSETLGTDQDTDQDATPAT